MMKRTTFRPAVRELESRLAPAVVVPRHFAPGHHLSSVRHITSAVHVSASTQVELAYLQKHIGARVGGGECAQMTTEALRVAGFEFVLGKDNPAPGDYVWGKLVKVIQATGSRPSDSSPSARVQPGDVLQFRNAVMSTGFAYHHTAIVAAVNARGLPTKVYEQNVAANGALTEQRWVHVDPIDVTTLRQGWVRVYRPMARSDAPGQFKFTIVNNTPISKTVFITMGTASFPIYLMPAHTTLSYLTQVVTTWGGIVPMLTLGGATTPIANGGGYQITAGSGTVQRLNP
jgi:hypothetical protein